LQTFDKGCRVDAQNILQAACQHVFIRFGVHCLDELLFDDFLQLRAFLFAVRQLGPKTGRAQCAILKALDQPA